MVSKEGVKSTLTNSESDSEAAAAPSTALALQKYSLDSRQVRKRNKALQVRFKDICEAQNEQREAARRAGKPLPYKVAYRKYMTVPARRSIPNVTRSTGVQTSPDLKKRYQTFPFERKKGHGLKHAAAVEPYKGRDNGVVVAVDGKHSQTDGDLDVEPYLDDDEEEDEEGACGGGGGVRRTRALLHTNELSCTADSDCLQDTCLALNPADRLLHLEEGLSQTQPQTQSQTLPDRASRVTGPIAWNSLTQVECLDSPSVRSKRKKTLQLNGLQSEPPPLTPPPDPTQDLCKQIVPMNQDGEVKAQLQAMENLISSSQETIKVLLGVIQELEKGEAHREGLSYRTGQDTANCDTCRNSACIIYSVELDFKLQEDKLQPLMKRLCPIEDSHLPALPYAQDPAYSSSTPRRKSKHESKKHARWRLWFL